MEGGLGGGGWRRIRDLGDGWQMGWVWMEGGGWRRIEDFGNERQMGWVRRVEARGGGAGWQCGVAPVLHGDLLGEMVEEAHRQQVGWDLRRLKVPLVVAMVPSTCQRRERSHAHPAAPPVARMQPRSFHQCASLTIEEAQPAFNAQQALHQPVTVPGVNYEHCTQQSAGPRTHRCPDLVRTSSSSAHFTMPRVEQAHHIHAPS